MSKKTSKLALNFKILRFFLIPTFLFSTPFFHNLQDAKAGLEFQWDQDSGFRRLKWFQTENKRRFRNKIYFFLKPSDRNSELLKITLAIPQSFNSNLKKDKVSLCKVKIGGFDDRTRCLEDIPADVEINTDESSLRSINIYPFSPIPFNKDNYAITLKVFNPKRSGLYQIHSYGQLKGNSVSSYLGSWTIVID
tara:strand:- start:158 stop:736 length:579 start_codon:yes stop_codon:yes gene_type:complete